MGLCIMVSIAMFHFALLAVTFSFTDIWVLKMSLDIKAIRWVLVCGTHGKYNLFIFCVKVGEEEEAWGDVAHVSLSINYLGNVVQNLKSTLLQKSPQWKYHCCPQEQGHSLWR